MTKEEAEALIGTTVYANSGGTVVPVTYSIIHNVWEKNKWREPKWVPRHFQYYPGCGTTLYDTIEEATAAALATIKSDIAFAEGQIEDGQQQLAKAHEKLAALEAQKDATL